MLCNLLSDQISICTLEDTSDDNNKDTGRVYTCKNLWRLFNWNIRTITYVYSIYLLYRCSWKLIRLIWPIEMLRVGDGLPIKCRLPKGSKINAYTAETSIA